MVALLFTSLIPLSAACNLMGFQSKTPSQIQFSSSPKHSRFSNLSSPKPCCEIQLNFFPKPQPQKQVLEVWIVWIVGPHRSWAFVNCKLTKDNNILTITITPTITIAPSCCSCTLRLFCNLVTNCVSQKFTNAQLRWGPTIWHSRTKWNQNIFKISHYYY